MTKEVERMIEMIKEAYVKVMGLEKWNSLTDNQKHDAIMILAKDFDKAISNI